MRTGDVVAHLLQAHGQTWTASQPMLRYLLQTVMASRGCICNPQAHEVGLAHICTPLRQVAMLMVNGDVPLLVPYQFSAAALAPVMTQLNHAALQQRLTDILVSRDFTQLWTDQVALTGLRSRCLTCGGHFHPPELLRHLLTVHPQTCAWATQIAFQLYEPMQQLQQRDFQCNFCLQVFNLPDDDTTPAMQTRTQLQRSHLVSSCPVVLQISTLLQPIHGRPDGSQRPSTDGGPGSNGSVPPGHQETSRRKRRRAPAQTAQTQDQGRTKGRRTQQRSNHHAAALDGQPDSQPREEHPAQPPTGLLRYVLPKSAGGNSPTPHGTGQTVEGGMAETAGQPEVAQPAHISDAGGHQGASSPHSTIGQQQTRGASMGCGHHQGHDPSRRGMELPEVVGGDQTTGPSLQAAHGHANDA